MQIWVRILGGNRILILLSALVTVWSAYRWIPFAPDDRVREAVVEYLAVEGVALKGDLQVRARLPLVPSPRAAALYVQVKITSDEEHYLLLRELPFVGWTVKGQTTPLNFLMPFL